MSFTIQPLLDASPVIQFHVFGASTALLLGPLALYRKRRDRIHKIVGYIWVLAMATAAMSSFWIHDFPVIGPFSPIHLLAVFALWSLFEGMRHVFAGRIRHHQIVMRSLYVNGLLVAGMFNFLPYRVTNRIFFPDAPQHGYMVLALGLAAIVLMGIRRRRILKRLTPANPAPHAPAKTTPRARSRHAEATAHTSRPLAHL